MGILANENAISAGGYSINNSLRFQSASSQYLSRTPASAGSRTTWTWSAWVKRGVLSANQSLLSAGTGSANFDEISFLAADTLTFSIADSNVIRGQITTSAVFRDPSAWYHVVAVLDTTNATAANRMRLYINGTLQTVTINTQIAQNYASGNINNNVQNTIGARRVTTLDYYLDGYQTEVNFIDGQALTPSSFGETNTLTGQWVAKKYTGTYGTNGFYLPFSNGTSTTTLGADSSGNGNNWTLTNFTRSAGVSDCWMYDVPSGNGGVSGTQPSSNYAVLNPLHRRNTVTYARANLQFTLGAAGNTVATNSIAVSSGKYYCEVLPSALTGPYFLIGLVQDTISAASMTTSGVGGVGYYAVDGTKFVDGVNTAYGATYTSGNLIGVALDLDSSTVTFYKDNVSQGAITIPSGKSWYIAVQNGTGTGTQIGDINFGQRSFAYTPPSGFKALCTANLPASTIVKGNEYMDATTYTGNGSTQTITNAGGFSPDLVWLKGRSAATGNALYDTIRGPLQYIASESTVAESTVAGTVTAFNSNGFSIGSQAGTNANTATYVAWQWDAGSSTVTNTSGTISSQVRANTTAGFSIVTYTGNGLNNQTVGHGLGVTPSFVIYKSRGAVNAWTVTSPVLGVDKYLALNTTAAVATAAGYLPANTSSVLSVSGASGAGGPNQATTMVAYCFAEIAGFSKIGSYTGNGSADGPFVYCGFRPKFVMIKASSTAENWNIIDSVRGPYNLNNLALFPSLANAETANIGLDLLSNGFKLRTTNTVNGNASGATYIYMAFAESPFQNSNSR